MPDQDKLIAAIDSYSESAIGGASGELARQRALALDAFGGKNIEPAPEGRSQVVDWSMFESVMWIMPSLMRIYGGIHGDAITEFDPVGPVDEEAAEQESEVLNHLILQKTQWDIVARTWMQDALITKNAYCLCYNEEILVPEKDRYEGQTEEQLAIILDDDVEVVGQNAYQDPDDEGKIIHPATGQPVEDEEGIMEAQALYAVAGMEPQIHYRTLYDIEIKRTKPVKRLRMKVLAPEKCRVGNNTTSFDLEDCGYFEYRETTTISALRKLGFEIDDDIADDVFTESEEEQSRNEILETDNTLNVDDADPSLREVVARHIWLQYDYDGDGIAEMQYVLRVGDRVFEREELQTIPVACIVPFMNTHRHMGISVGDAMFDIQRIKTALLRAGLDGLNLALNPRHYVNMNAAGPTTIDDLLVSRPGGVVRGEGIPGEAVMALPTENTFPYAQQGLEYMGSVTEARVGVSRAFTGIDSNALGGSNEHNVVGQLSSMAAQRVEDIARLFAPGFKRLMRIAHELVIKSGHSGESIKLRGKWVNFDPTQWRTGREMRIVAPFAAGNKDSLLQRLMILKGIHAEALAAGVSIVDEGNAYNLALEISKAMDVNGAKFFTDPETVEPAPPPPDYTAIALQIEDKKADNEAADESRQAELDKYKADLGAEMDKYKADLNAELQVALANIKGGQQLTVEQVRSRAKDAKST
jgi:hypothetical protein